MQLIITEISTSNTNWCQWSAQKFKVLKFHDNNEFG